MDHDHVRGTKITNVSSLVKHNKSIKLIDEEIAKCDLVCCLCHGKRTHDRKPASVDTNEGRARNNKIINEFKNTECYICNIKHELYNMECDHIDHLNKFANISKLKDFKVETLMLELNKCKPICTLCHRKKTFIDNKNKVYIIHPKIKKKKLFIDNDRRECCKCNKIKNNCDFTRKGKLNNNPRLICKDCQNKYRRELRSNKKILNKNENP